MKRIGILGLSNPCSQNRVEQVVGFLEALELDVLVSDILTKESSAKQRADVFNEYMKMGLDAVFDLSGGDAANGTLPYLDWEAYQNSATVFHGYSDLTCVLNPLAQIRPCVLFQIAGNNHREWIASYLKTGDPSLFETEALGGNLRCLLKLAGTPYFPDFKGQDLLLESYSGHWERIDSSLNQLEQMGVFSQIRTLYLGEFTELDALEQRPLLNQKVRQYGLPVKEVPVGHSPDSKAVWIKRK